MQTIKEAAQTYHEQGLSVVPFYFKWNAQKSQYNKAPDVEKWGELHTRKQTSEEFNAVNWDLVEGFALLAGEQNSEGLYLAVVDYDVKGFRQEHPDIIEKTEQKLAKFRITQREETINEGQHLIYWNRIRPISRDYEKQGYYIELLGLSENNKKEFVVMAPSKGYRSLTNNTPTVLDNINAYIDNLLDIRNPITIEAAPKKETKAKEYTKGPRPCMFVALQKPLEGKEGHYMRLAIATEFKAHNYPEETIVEMFHCQKDFDEEKTREQIRSADPLKTAKCKTIKSYGYCLPNCTFYQKKPKQNSPEPSTKWPDIPEPAPYGSSTQLTNDIQEYLRPQLILPKEKYYTIIAEWIKASWIPELFEAVPYLWFFGPSDSGKTRGGSLIHQLAYKAIFGPDFSESSLFRTIEQHHCTVIIDETDTLAKDTERANTIIAVLNSGYTRDQKVWRDVWNVENQDWTTKGFDVFGFKVIIGTRFIRNTLERRCIKIPMQKRKVKRAWRIDKNGASILRAKLAKWREDILKLVVSDILDVYYEGIYNNKKNDLEIKDGSLIQLFSPLLFTSADTSLENVKNVKNVKIDPTPNTGRIYLAVLEAQGEKEAGEATDFDADIVRAVIGVKKDNGKISTREVADVFNAGKKEKEQWKTRTVGHQLKKLGFINTRLSDSSRGYLWDPVLVLELATRYGIDFKNEMFTFEQSDNSVETAVFEALQISVGGS